MTKSARLTQYAHGGGCACKIPPGELEAVVAGLVGAVLAIAVLVLFKATFIDNVLGGLFNSGVLRPIDGLDILLVSPWLLLTSIGISAITGYVTLRLYVRQ